MDSLEKVRIYAERMLDEELPAPMAAFIAPQIPDRLPKTASELDAKLEALARDMLALRSDEAPGLEVVHA